MTLVLQERQGPIKPSAASERGESFCRFPPCSDTFGSHLPSEHFLS